jgi:hypothetical protein
MSDPSGTDIQPTSPIEEPKKDPVPERDPVTPDPYPVTDPIQPRTHPDTDPSHAPHRDPEPFPTPPEPVPQYPPDVTFYA